MPTVSNNDYINIELTEMMWQTIMFDRNCIGTSLENNFLVNSAFSVTIFSITKSLLFFCQFTLGRLKDYLGLKD